MRPRLDSIIRVSARIIRRGLAADSPGAGERDKRADPRSLSGEPFRSSNQFREKRPVDPDGDTLCRRRYFGCLQLLPGRVPAAQGVPGDQAEPGGAVADRGAERGTGTAVAQRPAGARSGQDAAGLWRCLQLAVQEDLHVQARERVDTLRRHSRLHRHLVHLQRQRAGQDTQRALRAIRSAQRTVRV